MNLTSEQHDAVNCSSSVTVIASAGTGKTTVLTDRFAQCLRNGVPPFRILAFTFTEKATREMKERILKKSAIGFENVPLLNVSTIHSFLSQILKKHGSVLGLAGDFEILDDNAHHIWLKGRVRKFVQRQITQHNDLFLSFYRSYGLTNLIHAVESLVDANLTLKSETLIRTLNDLEKSEKKLFDAFLRANRDFQHELLEERITSRTLSYDDLETLSLRLFENHPELTDKLQNLYKHILVDEFQDVSPQQFAIIRHLHHPQRNTLFIVGDPKQSIYGFRQADTALFFTMENMILKSGGKTIYLSETFRTPKTVQDFFNGVFGPILNQGNVELFKPANTKKEDDTAGIFSQALPNEDADSTHVMMDYAVQIRDLVLSLFKQGTKPRDIAILSLSRKNFTLLKSELNKAGISCVSEAKSKLFDEDLVLFLYHALLYLGGNHEMIVQMGLLKNPFFTFEETFIENLVRTHKGDLFTGKSVPDGNPHDVASWRRLTQNLNTWKDEAKSLFVKELIYSIFSDIVPTPSARDLFLLDSFVAILSSWQKQGFTSLVDVAELISALEESDVSFTPPDASEDGVRLLTIHGAKGLEFDHVILIPGSENKSERKTFLYKKDDGFYFKLSPESEQKGLKYELSEPEDYAAYKTNLAINDRAETARLIYVALTRTMKTLFLFPPAPSSKKLREQLQKSPKNTEGVHEYNNWLCWLSQQEGVKPLLDFRRLTLVSGRAPQGTMSGTLRDCANQSNATHLAEPPPSQLSGPRGAQRQTCPMACPPQCTPASEESPDMVPCGVRPLLTVTELETFDQCQKRFELAHLKKIQALKNHGVFTSNLADIVKSNPSLSQRTKITSIERGLLIHEILQYYDPSRDNFTTVMEQALFNQNLTDPDGTIQDECKSFLTNLKKSDFLNGVLFSGATAHHELEFSFNTGNIIVTGQIDKLVQLETPHGPRWTIVDYKSHRYGREFEEIQLTERFKFQMLCYALAVKKGFEQDEVETIVIFTSTGDSQRLSFSKATLKKFEIDLNELYGEMLSSIASREFRHTKNKKICEKCSYYANDYCGVKASKAAS